MPLQSPSSKVTLDPPELAGIELRIPLGITQPVSVVVVLGEERAKLDASCDEWSRSVKQRFILCQAEPELNGTLEARSEAVSFTLRGGLRATKRRYGAYVSSKDVVLVGVSKSADVVVDLVRKTPDFFSRMALVEGGFSSWTAVDSGRLSRIDSARALLVCSTETCEQDSARAEATLHASGVPVRRLPGAGSGARDGGKAGLFPRDYAAELEWLGDGVPSN